MPRKMILHLADGASPLLEESRAENEYQLQELVKDNPDLLPVDDFGLSGDLMVVGRETSLPSGAVDLACLARSGELLIVEFKTGPQNSDFRSALSQLTDYGSDVWTMSFDEFESTVALRYFASDHCKDPRVRGQRSVEHAARAIWDSLSDEEFDALKDRLSKQLETGSFLYVLVAQRFTPTVERSIEYLNSTSRGPQYFAVELVRFDGEGASAFESRTIVKPRRTSARVGIASSLDAQEFLLAVSDSDYRAALEDLFDASQGLGLRLQWGTSGVSIRIPTPEASEPVTIGWVFVPGRAGWSGLRDVNLGFAEWSAGLTPAIRAHFDEYLGRVGDLPGAEPVEAKPLMGSAFYFAPAEFVRNLDQIRELYAELMGSLNQSTGIVTAESKRH